MSLLEPHLLSRILPLGPFVQYLSPCSNCASYSHPPVCNCNHISPVPIVQPAFCSTLLEINALCYELRTGDNTRLMAAISPNFIAIDAFLEEQSAQRAHAAKAFEQIVDKLQAGADLRSICVEPKREGAVRFGKC